VFIDIKNKENMPTTIKGMIFSTIHGVPPVVAKQSGALSKYVIF